MNKTKGWGKNRGGESEHRAALASKQSCSFVLAVTFALYFATGHP